MLIDSHKAGELACLKVEMKALELGAVVSKPSVEYTRYDRVIDWGGKLYRAQVKGLSNYSTRVAGSVTVDLRKSGNVYTATDIDVMVVYLPELDKVYWLPIELFTGTTKVFRYSLAKNGQQHRCTEIGQYEWGLSGCSSVG